MQQKAYVLSTNKWKQNVYIVHLFLKKLLINHGDHSMSVYVYACIYFLFLITSYHCVYIVYLNSLLNTNMLMNIWIIYSLLLLQSVAMNDFIFMYM